MRTIESTVHEYLRDPAANLRSPASRKNYRSVLGKLAASRPKRRLSSWTEEDLVRWLTGTGLAQSSIGAYRNVVSSFFDWCHWRGYVSEDPSRHLKKRVRPRSVPARHHNWLSRSEVRAMLDVCDDGSPIGRRDRVVLMLGFHTGLRREELSTLTWGQIGTAEVRVVGKGEKAASVPLSADLRAELSSWQVFRAETTGEASQPAIEGAPVVVRARRLMGEPDPLLDWDTALGPFGIGAIVKRRGHEADVGNIAPHDMRRTFAGLLESDGIPVDVISKLLRHSDLSTTQRYLADNPHKAQQAMQGFKI